MKKLDKILSWLILAAIISVVATQIIKNAGHKSKIDLPTLSLIEAQESFPLAASVTQADTSLFLVTAADGAALGTVLFSAPYSDAVRGYAGKMPLKIILDKDGKIASVTLLANKETPRFIDHVIKEGFFDSWTGLTPQQALNTTVDAVSGATFSSNGVQQSLKVRLAAYTLQEDSLNQGVDRSKWLADAALLIVLALALVCFFVPRKTKTLRLITLLLSVIVIGFWRDSLLSLVSLYGWLTSGVSLTTQWILLLIAVLAIMLPLFTRKAYYCMYVCPMGALQEFAGKACKKKMKLSNMVLQVLLVIRKLFLLTILILLAFGVSLDLAAFEPFSVFNWQSISLYAIIFAAVILILSLFINRFWCRFLCPTGLILELVREIRGKKKAE